MLSREWFNPKYSKEVSLLFVWISAIIPWHIQYTTIKGIGSLYYYRSALFQIRFQLGFQLMEHWFFTPYHAYKFQGADNLLGQAYLSWLIGAVIFLAPLALTVVYLLDDKMEDKSYSWLPDNPSKLFGILLGLTAVSFTVAAIQFHMHGYPGPKFPVGLLFIWGFVIALLTNDRDRDE